MALAVGNTVVPKTIFPSDNAGEGFDSGIVVDKPVMGVVTAFSSPDAAVTWNDGRVNDGTLLPFVDVTALRFVGLAAQGTRDALLGKLVQLNDGSPEFRGAVKSVFSLEIDATNNTGTVSEVVLVQSRTGFYFLALVSDVTVVTG
jgi:hypothetical protein